MTDDTAPITASDTKAKARDARRKARRDSYRYHVKDHAILRYHWHNFARIAPGVYRSNHPTHARFESYKAMGIGTILNLRGRPDAAHYRAEVASCKALGLTLISTPMYARKPADRKHLLQLIDHMRTIPKPFLMHCKSGADRAGFASALYLLDQEGADMAQARRMLSFRFLHIRATATGVLDHILDLYEARLKDGPIGIRDWIATDYDADEVRRSWAARGWR